MPSLIQARHSGTMPGRIVTRTTSTTASGQACSRWRISGPRSRSSRRFSRKSTRPIPVWRRRRIIHELTRRVITRFIEDAIDESFRRIGEDGVASPEAAATAGRAIVALSPPFEAADGQVKSFLFSHMYRHPAVRAVRDKADAIVRRLFEAYVGDPSLMPPDWAAKAAAGDRERAVADYIAGMTDRFAVHEHARLFDGPLDLR